MLYGAVLGVSGDDVESHVKFIGDQQIPFQLLADEGNQVLFTILSLRPVTCKTCHAMLHLLHLLCGSGKIVWFILHAYHNIAW